MEEALQSLKLLWQVGGPWPLVRTYPRTSLPVRCTACGVSYTLVGRKGVFSHHSLSDAQRMRVVYLTGRGAHVYSDTLVAVPGALWRWRAGATATTRIIRICCTGCQSGAAVRVVIALKVNPTSGSRKWVQTGPENGSTFSKGLCSVCLGDCAKTAYLKA